MITNEEITRAAVQCTCVCCSSLRQTLLAHLDAKDQAHKEHTSEINRLRISERAWKEIASNRLHETESLIERIETQRQTIEIYQRKIDDIADLVA